MLSKELDSGGFYKALLERIEHGEVRAAAEMITGLSDEEQLAILFRLARALARALAHTNELAVDSDLGFDLALARALTRALDSSLALVRTRAQQHDLARATSLAFDLARTLARARARAHEHNLARALAHAADYVEVTTLVLQRPTDVVTLVGLDVLTPEALDTRVTPLLKALALIQEIVDQLEGTAFTPPQIVYIAHESPTEIKIEGITRALEVLKGFVLPRWSEYMEQQTDLAIEEKQWRVGQLQNEIHQLKERLQQSHPHGRQRVFFDNDATTAGYDAIARKKFIFQQEKIHIVASLVEQLAPHLSEAEHIAYTTRLLEALDVVFDSPLNFLASA